MHRYLCADSMPYMAKRNSSHFVLFITPWLSAISLTPIARVKHLSASPKHAWRQPVDPPCGRCEGDRHDHAHLDSPQLLLVKCLTRRRPPRPKDKSGINAPNGNAPCSFPSPTCRAGMPNGNLRTRSRSATALIRSPGSNSSATPTAARVPLP